MNMSTFENVTLDLNNVETSTDYDHIVTFDKNYSSSQSTCTDVQCVFLATAYAIICILGITGNGLVIWIAGINCMWYLCLAVFNFIFCSFLPFVIIETVINIYALGSFMCKFTNFIFVLNMYGSIFFLVLICMNRCVVVIFPVWAQKNRTVKKCLIMLMFTSIFATALSTHPATTRELHIMHGAPHCTYNTAGNELLVMMLIRFVIGFAIPVLIIICCYISIMLKLGANRMTKPFKVMTLLIVMFIVCWFSHHIINIVESIGKHNHIVESLQIFSFLIASSNSCMSPLVYAFMGKDPNNKFYNIRSKIKNAFEEEDQSTIYGMANTNQEVLSTTS